MGTKRACGYDKLMLSWGLLRVGEAGIGEACMDVFVITTEEFLVTEEEVEEAVVTVTVGKVEECIEDDKRRGSESNDSATVHLSASIFDLWSGKSPLFEKPAVACWGCNAFSLSFFKSDGNAALVMLSNPLFK